MNKNTVLSAGASVEPMGGFRASQQDGSYPRPLIVRSGWTDLTGEWGFAADDETVGLQHRWHADAAAAVFDRSIRVPFTMEAPLSGIDDPDPHPVVWYRRTFSVESRPDERVLLHFGAVDYRASVWVDGSLVLEHAGGQTAFSADITDALNAGVEHVLVVRAEDALDDPDRPRGKQDWREELHGIWYRRATGIWGPVWLEHVPELYVVNVDWQFDAVGKQLEATVWLNAAPTAGATVKFRLSHDGELLASMSVDARSRRIEATIDLPALRNAHEAKELLWSPERPTLIDTEIEVTAGANTDRIWSYTGLRSLSTSGGAFCVNGRPIYLRSVLEQGYWPDGGWTAPSPAHLKSEVEIILALGFNSVRIHQKVEDPRFLYWCDRLGLMVWGEIGAAYGFSSDAIEIFWPEWSESLRQRRSYPSVVAWVPFNESWGVHDIELSVAQQNFVKGVTALTRALDPTRPVISNDGWEHVDSDILSIHDYASDPRILADRYGTRAGIDQVLQGPGPYGRRVALPSQDVGGAGSSIPVMLTEFGGIAFRSGGTWGYAVVSDDAEFDTALEGIFDAIHGSEVLTGFCFTQLTDTAQEANGLLRDDRSPKLPVARIRELVTGAGQAGSRFA